MHLFQKSWVFFLLLGLLACKTEEQHPVKNPYPDGYKNIASLSHRQSWHTANIHDPSCIKVGDTYYLYATDAYYIPPNIKFKDDTSVVMGNIPIRSSQDLVHWKFEGWAFDKIPPKAFDFVTEANHGKSPDNIWAPYIREVGDEFRLYYSVSYFGTNGSYIGMATSSSPLGPWVDKGEVVKTTYESKMNAIDPTIVSDYKTGKDWMIYGSYFGGLFCMELDPETGLALKPGDQGHVVACRAQGRDRIIEAPEIIYNPDEEMYYLFVSYDPLFTFYNLRVGRSTNPEGPYLDFFGNDMRDTTNNYPILTHSYMFYNHPGWSGNAHCAVINDDGKYYAMHQGRLAPDNLMMRMFVREIKWLSSGWPVLSPERYLPVNMKKIDDEELGGIWEVVELQDLPDQVKLWQGQIPAGGWYYSPKAFNVARKIELNDDLSLNHPDSVLKAFNFKQGALSLAIHDAETVECAVFRGWDWENEKETILFSGILPNGHGIWGKKL